MATITGTSGNDMLMNQSTNDQIMGLDGNDTIDYNLTNDGTDQINLGAGDDTVNASADGASQIRVSFTSAEVGNNNANDAGTLANQDGGLAVRLQAEDAAGVLTGNIGRTDDEGVTFVAAAGARFDVRDLSGAQRGDFFNTVQLGTQQADFINKNDGTNLSHYINGGQGDDLLIGGDGRDFLVGGAGSDTLIGGAGNNSYIGGAGNNSYIGGTGSDTIMGGAGVDTVEVYNLATDGSDDIDLAAGDDVVKVSSTGATQIRVSFTSSEVGNNNVNDANTQANQDGGLAVRLQAEDAAGALTGSIGRTDDEGINFLAAAGITFDVRDLVSGVPRGDTFSVVSLGTSAADIIDKSTQTVNYYVNGGMGNDVILGGSANDFLVGGAGNDVLSGGAGNDSFIAGTGNDNLTGGDGNDTVVSYNLSTDGIDKINLGAGDDVVNVSSTGATQIRVTFTSAEVGNANANDAGTLTNQDGGLAVRVQAENGSDGLVGNVARTDDEGISFVAAAGTTFDVRDLVSGVARGDQFNVVTLGTNQADIIDESAETTNYYVNGGQGDDIITGGLGNDFLVGGAGADTLTGGAGDDSFIGGGGNDIINAHDGNDTIAAYNLATDGVDQINLGAGDDVVKVSSTGATQIRVSFTSAEVGNNNANDAMSMTNQDGGLAVRVQAEGANDTLTGNVARTDDEGISFVAAAGTTFDVRDLVSGAARGDQFNVVTLGSNMADTIDESAETTNYYVNGGQGDDMITGGLGNDFLVGGAGADTLTGGAGDDSFIGGGGNDIINGGEGVDTIAAYNLTTDGVDQINLGTGDDVVNVSSTGASQIRVSFTSAEVGNANANDAMSMANQDGGLAVRLQAEDAMGALTGNIGRTDDEGISFVAAAGTTFDVRDLVSGVARGNQFNVVTLGTNMADVIDESAETTNYYVNGGQGDDIITGGSGNDFLVGGAGADTLTGGAGNDSFIGGAGADTMSGGSGDDIFIVDDITDVVKEMSKQGNDVIQSSVNYSLSGRYVETLQLTGSANINATGHEYANTLIGNSGNNILNGGRGADSLSGGLGNDTYLLNRGFAAETISENDSTAGNNDILLFGSNIAADQLWFSQVNNDLKVSVIGTGDSALIKDWYSSDAYHIEQFKSGNGRTLNDENVQNLVNAMAGMTPPPMGQTNFTAAEHAQYDGVINASWA